VAEADGESGDAREPLEIESFERLDDKVKFRCECGKRITAPARAQRKTGKCPRCGRRLLLPAVETKRKPRTVIGGKPPAPKAPASPRPDKPEQAGTSKPEPGKESAETTCPHCDAVAPAGNRFCGACGKPLQEEPEPAPRAAAPRPEKRVLPAGVRPTNDAASAVAERLRRHRAPATLRPASCFIRILAGLVDVSLIVGAVALLYLQVPEPWYLAAAAGVVVALLNEVVMVVLTSRTLGKSIFGLRLVDRRGDSMGLAGALVRLLVKYPLAFLAWWMFILPDRRTIHDLAAGRSLVVRD
jgi:uncharacterized RDD family membrane protein YckC